MPKSKRAKVVNLTKTKKKGKSIKNKLVVEIRNAADEYERCVIFSSVNMRNNGLKTLRNKWKGSRVFMGKNKVMALALGKTPETEHKDGLSQVAKNVTGHCGILFTNQDLDSIKTDLAAVNELHFARSGFVATERFNLPEGIIDMPFSMETTLRKYGLHTSLKDGKIILGVDTDVCKPGDILTPEQCKLLELFQVKMARFRMFPECAWEATDGSFQEFPLPDFALKVKAGGSKEGAVMDDDDGEWISD